MAVLTAGDSRSAFPPGQWVTVAILAEILRPSDLGERGDETPKHKKTMKVKLVEHEQNSWRAGCQ
jgi:hypothetical protein